MKIKVIVAGLSAVLCLSWGWVTEAQQVSLQDALNQTGLVQDAEKISDWFSNQLGSHLGFYAASGAITPGNPLGGLPHFEIGVGAGADLASISIGAFPKEALTIINQQNLPLDQLPGGAGIPLPLPLWALHGNLGIFGGIDIPLLTKIGSIDVGGKFGYVPKLNFGAGDVESLLFGGQVRIGILQESLIIPGVSLSLGYDSISGGFSIIQKDFIKDNQINVPVTVSGVSTTVNGTISGDIDIKNTYNASAIGGKLLVSKGLLFIVPYAGVGFQLNSGQVKTTISPTVRFSNVGSSANLNIPIDPVTLTAGNPVNINSSDLRLIGGLELRIIILGLALEWNGKPDFSDNFVGLGVRLNI